MTASDSSAKSIPPLWALKTPLFDLHAELHGYTTGRWKDGMQVPAYYGSIMREHHILREAVGLVDLGRRGLFRLSGPAGASVLELLLTTSVAQMEVGQWKRIPFVGSDGLMVDFARVGRLDEQTWLVFLANAVAAEALGMLKTEAAHRDCELDDISAQYAWMAIVGPRAHAFVSEWTRGGDTLAPGKMGEFLAAGVACTLWRESDNYYELFCQPELLIKAAREGLGCASAPEFCGWAAFENWRLEEGCLRHGFEIKEGISPFDLGLDNLVDLNREAFLARPALAEQSRNGSKYMLVYFSLDVMRLPRKGQALYSADKLAGRVAAGGFGLALNRPIAVAWVLVEGVDFDTLEIEIHRQRYPIKIRKPPLV
jgi:aminomethyltransferase